MIVGIDYWNTITRDVKLFTDLASALISEGNEVHIISAVGKVRAQHTAADIRATGVPYTDIHVLINGPLFDGEDMKSTSNYPQLKLRRCKELGVQMMIDDRKDICELLNANGIVALQVHREVK